MKSLLKLFALSALALWLGSVSVAPAQVTIQIGPAPICPYGYFSYPPYNCAPYGYYGPDWFIGGIFIGAGPWFHGPGGFYGHVDPRWDPRQGYHGPLPARGEQPFGGFHAGPAIDGRGRIGNPGHDGSFEHSPGFSGGGRPGGGGRR